MRLPTRRGARSGAGREAACGRRRFDALTLVRRLGTLRCGESGCGTRPLGRTHPYAACRRMQICGGGCSCRCRCGCRGAWPAREQHHGGVVRLPQGQRLHHECAAGRNGQGLARHWVQPLRRGLGALMPRPLLDGSILIHVPRHVARGEAQQHGARGHHGERNGAEEGSGQGAQPCRLCLQIILRNDLRRVQLAYALPRQHRAPLMLAGRRYLPPPWPLLETLRGAMKACAQAGDLLLQFAVAQQRAARGRRAHRGCGVHRPPLTRVQRRRLGSAARPHIQRGIQVPWGGCRGGRCCGGGCRGCRRRLR